MVPGRSAAVAVDAVVDDVLSFLAQGVGGCAAPVPQIEVVGGLCHVQKVALSGVESGLIVFDHAPGSAVQDDAVLGVVEEPAVLNSDMACRLVKLDQLTVTGGKDDENTDAYTIYTVTPDGVKVNIRIDADVAIKVNSIMKNKTWETFKDCTFLNVVGIVQPYYESYQLMVMNLTDLGYQN